MLSATVFWIFTGIFFFLFLQPIEVREALPDKKKKIEALGIASNEIKSEEQVCV